MPIYPEGGLQFACSRICFCPASGFVSAPCRVCPRWCKQTTACNFRFSLLEASCRIGRPVGRTDGQSDGLRHSEKNGDAGEETQAEHLLKLFGEMMAGTICAFVLQGSPDLQAMRAMTKVTKVFNNVQCFTEDFHNFRPASNARGKRFGAIRGFGTISAFIVSLDFPNSGLLRPLLFPQSIWNGVVLVLISGCCWDYVFGGPV